jgi:DNA/RNA endonuclease YhcR with UshA esterase domain
VQRTLLTLIAGILIAGFPVAAHHSFSSYYFEEQSVTISGEVEEFQYRSPHAIVMVNARDAEGRMRTYAAEFASPNRLAREGVNKDTLKPGDAVVVTGSPGRVPSEYKIHLKRIQRASDGWSWGGGRRR